jgi:hypothetical protein
MNNKLIVAILVLLAVVVAAGVLIATPAPQTEVEPFASENVKISSPLPNASVAKTFTVTGYARGTWYFEASFPVKVHDASGKQVGGGIAQAESDWMTVEFVPFSAPIVVADYSGPAALVLQKDNPSGLPEHDDSVSIPIVIQ